MADIKIQDYKRALKQDKVMQEPYEFQNSPIKEVADRFESTGIQNFEQEEQFKITVNNYSVLPNQIFRPSVPRKQSEITS